MKWIVLALATWRLTSLLVVEDGPFEVFVKLRHVLGVRYDDNSMAYGTNWFAKGLVCSWCASVWLGMFWATFFFLFPEVAFWAGLPFALSAGAVIVQRIVSN